MLGLLLFLAQAAPPAARPKEVLALVDQARALPPEFSADTMLRIAASPLIPDKQWRRELIEEAFIAGGHAQLPYPRSFSGSTDSRPNLDYHRNNLEALTLQTRAVTAILPIDAPRALAMFRDIPPLQPPVLTCQDAAIPDFSAYYQTAAALFDSAFTPKQRAAEEDVQFLAALIVSIQSPLQVVPAMKMLPDAGARMPPAQRQQVAGALAGVLDRLPSDARAYAASEIVLVSSAVAEMHDSQMFIPSLRSYVVRHLSGPRCTDSIHGTDPPESAKQFNSLTARLAQTTAQIRPIAPEETKPSKLAGTFDPHLMWQSARSKQVLDALRWLNHGNRDLLGDQRFWTLEERRTPEWNAHYLDTVKLIEGWQEDEEDSPQDYAFMVSLVYSELAQLVPPGKPRENAMDTYLRFLEQHYAALENRNFWFSLVQTMLTTARYSKDPKDQAWMLAAMSRSSNPIIALYAALEMKIGKP
jgi:hypothetical protein